MSMSFPKVLIVGAGIMGTMLAYDFARRGARVTLIDKGEVAKGTTSGSFAWITNQTKFRNADSLDEAGARHYFNLHRLSHLRWRYLQADVKVPLPIRWAGCLQLAPRDSDEAMQLNAELARRQRWGSPTYRLRAAEARELEPAMQAGDETFITFTPDEGMMAPVELTSTMLDEAMALGVEYSPHDSHEGFKNTSAGYEVTSAKGKREVDLLILAAGIANPELMEGTGLKAPLIHSSGSVVHLAPLPHLFDKVILSSDFNAIQRMDGRVVLSKHFSGSPIGDPCPPVPEELVEIASQTLPGLKGAVVEKVTNTPRVVPLDGLPIFSRSADRPGVAAITTNAGISLSAILSQLITTELFDGVHVDLLDPYRSDRF